MAVGLISRVKHSNNDKSSVSQMKVQNWRNGVKYGLPQNSGTARTTTTSVSCMDTYGNDIPHFHARRRRGELLPQTPFTQFKREGTTLTTYHLWYGNYAYNDEYWFESGEWNYYTSWQVTQDELALILQPSDTRFVQEAAAAIYSNGHDTLTFLAELASVRQMFVNTGIRLLDLVKGKNIGYTYKKLANDWLEARYGWRTLVFDIKSLNKAIQNLNSSKQRYSEKRGNQTTNSSSVTSVTTSNPSHVDHTKFDVITVGLRGSVIADIEVPQFQFNPLQTAWELIPFSFVVDWFLTVGKAISAASFLVYKSQYSASVGTFAEIDRTVNSIFHTCPTAWGTWEQTGTCKARLETRAPCSVPLTPHFTLNLNPYKILDLCGMLVQQLGRK